MTFNVIHQLVRSPPFVSTFLLDQQHPGTEKAPPLASAVKNAQSEFIQEIVAPPQWNQICLHIFAVIDKFLQPS